jgi:hypothetical protein
MVSATLSTTNTTSLSLTEETYSSDSFASASTTKPPSAPFPPALEVPRNQIDIRSQLSSGGFSIVYRAEWVGTIVAFKVPPLLSVS